MLTDPPATLPVAHLSAASVRTYLQSPERWRRRYMLGEYEPTSANQLLGSAVHRAEGESYQHAIDNGGIRPVSEVLDVFSDEFDVGVEQAPGGVDWEDERPGRVKDTGVRAVRGYHQLVAPTIRPLTVERRYVIEFAGVAWTFEGYLDLEVQREGVRVADLKMRSLTKGVVSAEEAAADLQVTSNLMAKRAEGAPAAGFEFHSLVRRPKVAQPRDFLITPAHRTEAELDRFVELIYRVAAMIHRSAETDTWLPAPPGSWWCSQRWCGFWSTCQFGGANRSAVFVSQPAPARSPSDSAVLEAVDATATKKDGGSTAKKVAARLGISVRSASARLQALCRAGMLESAAPTKASGRGSARVVVEVPGPRIYRRVTVEQV